MSIPSASVSSAAPSGAPADPCIIVIFGATGDLTRRKLVPALCNLAEARVLPENIAILAVAHREITQEAFREKLREDVAAMARGRVREDHLSRLLERTYYVRGELDEQPVYEQVRATTDRLTREHGIPPNHFYYLAVAPRLFGPIVRRLGEAGLAREDAGGWRRVVIEKPFGRDLESARRLNAELRRVLEERQIYRIDHYLGKETVQNILVFRFSNAIFEPIWNRRYIDHVQITAAETVGVEQRGAYYESAGALRDMVPNHLFQLLTLIAMEPPASFAADAVRDEQAKVLQAVPSFSDEDVLARAVRGQYGEGTVDGAAVPAYRREPRVSPDSTTETFAALKLDIDNWRWADVPFYLRTGKRLAGRVTEIAVQFRRPPFMMFRDTDIQQLRTNRLLIHIQPDEGISLRFGAKIPGPVMKIGGVDMRFQYCEYFGRSSSTGYERLLYDCMCGDQTLFQRADMLDRGWCVIAPIQEAWQAGSPQSIPNYAAGSWGPDEAQELMARDGRSWHNGEDDRLGRDRESCA